MKIGTRPEQDSLRVQTARKAIGDEAELFIDANGAYSRKQALDFAHKFREESNVTWFEEPVSADDPSGLRLLRDHGPAGMDIAAGEYAWRSFDLRALLEAGAVDVLQADATRCGGITGFLAASALAEAYNVPLSAHCGPSAHLHLACACSPLRHVEYFHDHARIDPRCSMAFIVRSMARCIPTSRVRALASISNTRTPNPFASIELNRGLMIYDLAQPLYNNGPQFPDQPTNFIRYYQRAVVKGATGERVEIMTHSGSQVDAPFHYKPELPSISELPLSHFCGPCVALDLRPIAACHPIAASDLRKHEDLIAPGILPLLKTGWRDRRANTKEFLTDWPYMCGDGARYLVERGIKGFGIDVLSTGGYPDEHAEADAHLELLGQQKLLPEDIHIPNALLDGERRHFAAFPIPIANTGGSWMRPIVWDTGDHDRDEAAPEQRIQVPASVAGLIALEREVR